MELRVASSSIATNNGFPFVILSGNLRYALPYLTPCSAQSHLQVNYTTLMSTTLSVITISFRFFKFPKRNLSLFP